MKVAVLNYSGSVGKTVIASHLLEPRIAGAEVIAVESTNESAADLGLDAEQLRGDQFGRLFRKLLTASAVIVDVGASNIEDFLAELAKYDDAQAEIDYFVLPVVSTGKAQRETIKTIAALASIGVDPQRIRVLFNMVDAQVEEEFGTVLGQAHLVGGFVANPKAMLEKNEVFELLAKRRMSIKTVVEDRSDYRKLLREADPADEDRVEDLGDRAALQALAKRVWKQMDVAFVEVFA